MVEIETERLILRDFAQGDLPAWYPIISDATGMRYLPELKVDDLAGAAQNLAEAVAEAARPDRVKFFFAVIERSTGALVGSVGYTVEAGLAGGKRVGLGYFYRKESWGRGYATEAARAVVAFAFTQDTVVKIETGCLKENAASERVMRNVGMKKEGELVRHQIHESLWKDRLLYGLTREDWLAAGGRD